MCLLANGARECVKYTLCMRIYIYTQFSKQSAGQISSFRAAPAMFNMWPSKIKIRRRKLKHALVAQQNGFGPQFFDKMLSLVDHRALVKFI